MLRGRLEAEGVPASVAHELHIGNNWPWSTGLGGAKVQVPEAFAGKARDIEFDCRLGLVRDALRDMLGDLDDPTCPVCGSHDIRRGYPTAPVLIAFVALLFFAPVPAWRWVWHCRRCGARLEWI